MDDHAPPAGSPGAFDAAEAAFRLLCAGPCPLARRVTELAADLPDRPVLPD